MHAVSMSSGDLTADRRYEWARDLAARGDIAAAADLLTQALELAPAYAAAWFALGEARHKLGQRDAAVAAFAQALAADASDAHGAAVRLVQLGASAQGAMPEGYIRALFNSYAPLFDGTLRKDLNYRAPELLVDAVRRASPAMTFSSAIDLGCGTGLAGQAFRALCQSLTGVDLSPAMLAQARGKGIYDRLAEADAASFLADEAVASASYALILAADVFVYFHDLDAILIAAYTVLEPGGLLAFSVETHDGDGVILLDTLRYAHGAACVRSAIAAPGFDLVSLESASTRTEKGVPVPGLVAVARRIGR